MGWEVGGRVPRSEILGDVPTEITSFEDNFLSACQFFRFSNIFLNKVTEIRGEIIIYG